jgi:hypothetical protein
MRTRLTFVLAILLAGCETPPMRVDTPATAAQDKSYTVDLPVGWIKQWTPEKNLVVTRDGYLLDNIAVVHRPLANAFPKTKKPASVTALPVELAELEIAELKATNEQLAVLKVLENDPAVVSGKEGFRLKVAFKNQRGLDYQRLVYGFADGSGFYLLDYSAPAAYYFEHYYPDFQKAVESFRLSDASAAKKP